MTKYYYRDVECSHSYFLLLLRQVGIVPGHRVSGYEKLKELAERGNKKAIELLSNVKVID